MVLLTNNAGPLTVNDPTVARLVTLNNGVVNTPDVLSTAVLVPDIKLDVVAAPDAPAGPLGPVGPLLPLGPVGPVGPLAPCGP